MQDVITVVEVESWYISLSRLRRHWFLLEVYVNKKLVVGSSTAGALLVFAIGFESGARFVTSTIRKRLEDSLPIMAVSLTETQFAIANDDIGFEEVKQRNHDTLAFLRLVLED